MSALLPKKIKRKKKESFTKFRNPYKKYDLADWKWINIFNEMDTIKFEHCDYIDKISKKYGINKETLKNKYSKYIKNGKKLIVKNRGGNNKTFTVIEERELYIFIKKKYINEMGVTKRFSEITLNTPPESMYKLYGEQAEQIIPKVDVVHDEMEVSISARQYGITTEEFRKRSKFADENCAYKSTSEMIDCMEAAKWGLSRSEYSKRIQFTEKCKLSDKEIEVLKGLAAQGAEWREHPAAIQNYECKISVMAGN